MVTLGYTDTNISVNNATRPKNFLFYTKWGAESIVLEVKEVGNFGILPYTAFEKENGDTFASQAELTEYLDANFFSTATGGGGSSNDTILFITASPSGNIEGLSDVEVFSIITSGGTLVKDKDFTKLVTDDQLTFLNGASLVAGEPVVVLKSGVNSVVSSLDMVRYLPQWDTIAAVPSGLTVGDAFLLEYNARGSYVLRRDT